MAKTVPVDFATTPESSSILLASFWMKQVCVLLPKKREVYFCPKIETRLFGFDVEEKVKHSGGIFLHFRSILRFWRRVAVHVFI